MPSQNGTRTASRPSPRPRERSSNAPIAGGAPLTAITRHLSVAAVAIAAGATFGLLGAYATEVPGDRTRLAIHTLHARSRHERPVNRLRQQVSVRRHPG